MRPPDGDEAVIGGTATPPGVPVPQEPAPGPEAMARRLPRLLVRHAAEDEDVIDALSQRLASDAEGALAGLTDQVRAAVESATDMADLARRLAALKLDDRAFAEALARGMALAQLAGQAELLDGLDWRLVHPGRPAGGPAGG